MALGTAYSSGFTNRYGTWPKDGIQIMFWDNNLGSYPRSGSVIYDLSGNARNGTLANFSNPPTSSSGYYNGAIQYDGVNDQILFPNSWLSSLTEFSFYIIFRLNSPPNNDNQYTLGLLGPEVAGGQLTIIRGFTPYTHYTPYFYFIGSSSNFEFYGNQGNIIPQLYTDLSKFYHIAFTVGTNQISLYANGVLFHQITKTIGNLTTPFKRIGKYGTVSQWKGQIPVVMAYDKVLSSQEVKQAYDYFKKFYS